MSAFGEKHQAENNISFKMSNTSFYSGKYELSNLELLSGKALLALLTL